MTQEDKQLLLVDICTRLPYRVKVTIEYSEDKYTRIYDLKEIDNDVTSELRQRVIVWNYGFYSSVISYPLIDCRPYLRPMTSMTEEEKREYNLTKTLSIVDYPTLKSFDWLNAHHFDYRGLIEKRLAISTKEYNPYKS